MEQTLEQITPSPDAGIAPLHSVRGLGMILAEFAQVMRPATVPFQRRHAYPLAIRPTHRNVDDSRLPRSALLTSAVDGPASCQNRPTIQSHGGQWPGHLAARPPFIPKPRRM